jgi:hypothetical protein
MKYSFIITDHLKEVNMKNILAKLVEYLKYPSTYKGLVAILGLIGVTIAPAQQEAITAFGIAVYGVISVFYSDKDVK